MAWDEMSRLLFSKTILPFISLKFPSHWQTIRNNLLIQLAPKRALLKDFYDFATEYSDNSASLNEIALSRFTSPVPDETILTIF